MHGAYPSHKSSQSACWILSVEFRTGCSIRYLAQGFGLAKPTLLWMNPSFAIRMAQLAQMESFVGEEADDAGNFHHINRRDCGRDKGRGA